MKIGPYINKLNESAEFKDFQKEHKDAFVVAGFFVIDFETNNNIHQIDYYVPAKKKIAAFTLDKQVTMQMMNLINTKVPEKLDLKTNLDLDQLYGILEDEMKNRTITAEIKKIIAILQNIDGKKIWNLSCVLSGMGLLNAHIEDQSKTVLKMEKRSLMDLVQKVNPQDLKAMSKGPEGEGSKLTKEQTEEQIKKLDQISKEIEKEKEALKKSEKPEKSKVKASKAKKK